MPQLDFVSFHYFLGSFHFFYLLVYILVTLFFLRPIFLGIFLKSSYKTRLILGAMLFPQLHQNKLLFGSFSLNKVDLTLLLNKMPTSLS